MFKNEVIRAISIYISLKGMNSRFDKNIRGEREDNFTASEKTGQFIYGKSFVCNLSFYAFN
jgi:hypothetical protein